MLKSKRTCSTPIFLVISRGPFLGSYCGPFSIATGASTREARLRVSGERAHML
jgi:hypothetical protein